MSYFIPQIDYTDCGFACLKMLIALLYNNKDALYIKQDETHGPYSFKEMKVLAEDYGITLEGIKVENKTDLKEMNLPLIALIKKGEESFHYVLVTKVKFKSVYYLDPDVGECRMDLKSFMKIWMSNALIVTDFIKLDCKFKDVIPLDTKNNHITTFLQIISSILLIIGVYFIDNKNKIYLPLIFIGLSIVFEISLRSYIVKRMEKYDQNFIDKIEVDNGKYSLFYKRYEDYKKSLIGSKMNIIFSFIVIIFISFIVLLNNIYNAFLILIPLFISIIDIKYISPSFKNKEHLIAIEEREINSLKNIDLLKKHIDKIHLRSYSLVKKTMMKKYIYLFIIFITSLLTSVFNETFSLPFLLFYFLIGYALLEQFTNFMNYPNAKIEFLRNKARLNNVLSKR